MVAMLPLPAPSAVPTYQEARAQPLRSQRQIARSSLSRGLKQDTAPVPQRSDYSTPADRTCFVERPLARPAQAAGRFLIAASSPDEELDDDPEQGPPSVPDAFSGAQEETQPSDQADQSEETTEGPEGQAEELEEDAEDDEDDASAGPMQFTDEELRDRMQDYLEWSQECFDIEDIVEVQQGLGGLPCVALRHPTGATAQVYLHGANIVSWTMPDGRELLHTMGDNVFDGSESIRGGIPILFPQVGAGRLPRGGFMSDLHWSLVDSAIAPGYMDGDTEDPAPSVILHAQDDPWTLSMFPHEFEALYTVSLMLPDEFDSPDSEGAPERIRGPGPKRELSKLQLDTEKRLSEGKFLYDPRQIEARRSRGRKSAATADAEAPAGSSGDKIEDYEDEDLEDAAAADMTQLPIQLRCKLDILNKSDTELRFTTSLQGHWAVKDLHTYFPFVRTIGLGGRYMMDSADEPAHPHLRLDNDDYLAFGRDQVDRLYINTHETEVRFCNGTPTHLEFLPRENFRDLQALSPLMTDPAEALDFVSLGAAEASRSVRLLPGETWSGVMVFRSHDQYWEYPLFEQMKASPYPGYEEELGNAEIPPGPPGIDQSVPKPAAAKETAESFKSRF